MCPSILNTKRKDLIRPHIKAVDQIILSNYNDYMITKSTDSVFVWKLTARLENDMLAGTEKIMAEMVTISKRSDHFFGKQSNILGLVSEINIGGPKDPDSFLKFREARSALWGLPRGVLEPKLIFNKSDLDKYKEDILLHSTSIRRSKPNVKPHYAGSNGIDTSESNPKIELSKDGSWLLTYCRGFPYIHNLIDDVQLRYEGHATQITSVSTHPSEFLVASSDTESNIHIWECKTGICLSKFKSPYAKGAVCLSFSDNERHLAGLFCVGTSYYIAIFDAHQGIMLSSVLIGSKSVRSIMYKKKLELVTIGKDHLSLWKLRNGMLFGETIPFGDCCSDLTCMALNKLDMVIGTSEGKISVLREQITEKKFNDDIKCRVTALSVSNLK